MSWTSDGLLLVCVLKQGSLCILPRYGQPMKLITHGCSMDMGPPTSFLYIPSYLLCELQLLLTYLLVYMYVCLYLSIYLSVYLPTYLSVTYFVLFTRV